MKAICVNRVPGYIENSLFTIEKGTIIDYTVNNSNKFIIKGEQVSPANFFVYFKVIDGDERLCYDDFEYILHKYIFKDGVMLLEQYVGARYINIQKQGKTVVKIDINKEENVIRISFSDKQEVYADYETALEGIRNHDKSCDGIA